MGENFYLGIETGITYSVGWEENYDGSPLVSIEESAADDMGVKIGDDLTFLIAGEKITAKISSIREVDWNSFSPNFFFARSKNIRANLLASL